MGTKRFKDQILAQILKACEGEGKSKTKVVYASGLNFRTIEPYLITLNQNGLIEIIPGEYQSGRACVRVWTRARPWASVGWGVLREAVPGIWPQAQG